MGACEDGVGGVYGRGKGSRPRGAQGRGVLFVKGCDNHQGVAPQSNEHYSHNNC